MLPTCTGLRIMPCPSKEALLQAAEGALRTRKIGAHNLNSRSNRSHLMLTVFIDSRVHGEGRGGSTYGSITFVDLAGSERLKVGRPTHAELLGSYRSRVLK